MPKLKFTRTPTEAEGGPNNKFEEGGVYVITGKSFNRWLNIGCAVEVGDEEVLVEAPVENFLRVHGLDEEKEEAKPEVKPEIKPEISHGVTLGTVEYKSIESGGQAPPIIVPKKNFIRSAGRGLYNVFDEDGKKLNINPMSRKDAEEF